MDASPTPPSPESPATDPADTLRQFFTAMLDLANQRTTLTEQIAALRKAAKEQGLDARALTQMLRDAKLNPAELAAWQQQLLDYREILGLLPPEESTAPAEASVVPPPKPARTRKTKRPMQRPSQPWSPADTVESATRRGRTAAGAGLRPADNPYPPTDIRHPAWRRGFDAAPPAPQTSTGA